MSYTRDVNSCNPVHILQSVERLKFQHLKPRLLSVFNSNALMSYTHGQDWRMISEVLSQMKWSVKPSRRRNASDFSFAFHYLLIFLFRPEGILRASPTCRATSLETAVCAQRRRLHSWDKEPEQGHVSIVFRTCF